MSAVLSEPAHGPGPAQRPELPQRSEPAQWHVDPVPARARVLHGLDAAVLWGSLGLSLLGLALAASFVPALGFWPAVGAAVLGSLAGAALLGVAAVPGARTGEPTMVLYRRVLGARGSAVPTVANVVQNVGFAAFELFVIAAAAQVLSDRLFGGRSRVAWVVGVGVVATGLAVAGPLTVVRRYLRTVGLWCVLAAGIALTVDALRHPGLGALLGRPGAGGTTFWAAVDLAVALPVSWVPLVADYSRFGASPRATGVGTGIGYLAAQVWFLVLGMLLLLPAAGPDVPTAVAAARFGLLLLAVLVVAETDKVFANVYSTAVSLQNLLPRLPGRPLTLAVGVVATALAAAVADLTSFSAFVFVVGSVFVPLTGVFVASWWVLGRREARPGVRFDALVAWAAGVAVYQLVSPGDWGPWRALLRRVFGDWLGLPFPLGEHAPWLGASLPSLAVSFGVLVALGLRRRQAAAA